MQEIRIPKLGETVEEVSIVEWLKAEGDQVSAGEVLCTLQTDKAVIEYEAEVSGVLRKILVDADIDVPVLAVVALVGEADEALPDLSQYGTQAPKPVAPAEDNAAAASTPHKARCITEVFAGLAGKRFASPRARRIAGERNVAIDAVSGSGPGGRIIASDVLAHQGAAPAQSFSGQASGIVGVEFAIRQTPSSRRAAELAGIDAKSLDGEILLRELVRQELAKMPAASSAPPQKAGAAKASTKQRGGGTPHSPMRRIIAERMVASKFSAPHFYLTVEIDMSKAMAYRTSQPRFKPSFNDLIMRAACVALQAYPTVNSRWHEDSIESVDDINVGFAVAVDDGLIVPVVKGAQQLSLEGLHEACGELITAARENKLTPDDYSGNTFTVSNLGGFGVDEFTAIINQPDSAILAIGQIKDRPVVVDGEIVIRPIMKLTLSSDHRVVDGAVAAQFMGHLKSTLETAAF